MTYRIPYALLLMSLTAASHDLPATKSTQASSCKPLAALMPAGTNASLTAESSLELFELQSTRWDPLLQTRWTVLHSCSHPERPSKILQSGTSASLKQYEAFGKPQTLAPAVHVGDLVHIRKHDAILQIDLTGIADESGPVGGLIRVHLLRRVEQNIEQSGLGQKQLLAIVRGPAEVEMQR